MKVDINKMKQVNFSIEEHYTKEELLKWLISAVNDANWLLAEKILQKYKENYGQDYTDVVGILESSIWLASNDLEKAWEATQKGLEYNTYNHELYYIQGEIKEMQQEYRAAYLCYLQSLFYAEKDDVEFIKNNIEEFIKIHPLFCWKITIIMSAGYSVENLKKSLNSIQKFVSGLLCDIVCLVDVKQKEAMEYLEKQNRVRMVLLDDKNNYTRARNSIIQELKNTDILLLSAGCILLPNTIHNLAMTLAEQEHANIAACSMYEDKIKNVYISGREEQKLCLYEAKGLLIRREFFGENQFDENIDTEKYAIMDLTIQNLVQNYGNLVNENSIVLEGNVRTESEINLKKDREYLKQKWGLDIEYYNGVRTDLIEMIKEDYHRDIKVLEIGCGTGATLLEIKKLYPNSKVYGLELQKEAAELGSKLLPIECGNIEDRKLNFQGEYFDYILMGDVLEHLCYPEDVLVYLKKFLKNEGYILASIPNIQHYSAFIPMLFGEFEYTNSGILDRTHLRFFTWNSIQNMFERINYKITEVRLNDTSSWVYPWEERIIDQLCKIDDNIDKQSFMTLQYCVKVQRKKEEELEQVLG